MSKILILANHYNTLIVFRRELIKTLVNRGNEVIVSIPPTDARTIKILQSYGCEVVVTPLARRGMNPLSDLLLTLRYLRLLTALNPDKVITYTIKPNIFGSLACKLGKKPHYANVTGLGSAFQSEGFTKKLVTFLYKLSLNKASKVFFENVGNREVFVTSNIVPREKTVVMAGAGVNLEEFSFCDYAPEGSTKFLFVGRIMKEKGVDEFFSAIEKIRSSYMHVDFDFIGWYEDDYEKIVADLEQRKLIRYHGFQCDVKPFIKNAHCIILPSYHEGMSNTLLEAAAMGRPIIASNINGCLETLIDGESGYLCKVKDSSDLYLKIKRFLELPYDEKAKMGLAARKHVENAFDKRKVVGMTLREILD